MPALTTTQHSSHDRLAGGRRWADEPRGVDEDLWRAPSWKWATERRSLDDACVARPGLAQRGRRMRASVLCRRSRR